MRQLWKDYNYLKCISMNNVKVTFNEKIYITMPWTKSPFKNIAGIYISTLNKIVHSVRLKYSCGKEKLVKGFEIYE